MQPHTYFQPYIGKINDETHQITWEFPSDLLYSFQAFATEEDALSFMEKAGYSLCEVNIERYCNDDIEEVSILDANGIPVDIYENEPETDILTHFHRAKREIPEGFFSGELGTLYEKTFNWTKEQYGGVLAKALTPMLLGDHFSYLFFEERKDRKKNLLAFRNLIDDELKNM